METFYATFGTGHAYHGCYVEIVAESHHAARAHMIKEHRRWAELYQEDVFSKLKRKYQRLAKVKQREGYEAGVLFFDVVRGK